MLEDVVQVLLMKYHATLLDHSLLVFLNNYMADDGDAWSSNYPCEWCNGHDDYKMYILSPVLNYS
jgi:hypothetical protein